MTTQVINDNTSKQIPITIETIQTIDPFTSIVTIDGCQYIRSRTQGDYYTYTHKGNCNNPYHHHTDSTLTNENLTLTNEIDTLTNEIDTLTK